MNRQRRNSAEPGVADSGCPRILSVKFTAVYCQQQGPLALIISGPCCWVRGLPPISSGSFAHLDRLCAIE